MTDFDGELYLRLAGERLLLAGRDQDRPPRDSPLLEAARALLAVAAIAPECAQQVIDDYELALALRGERQGRPMLAMLGARRARESARSDPGRVLEAPRVVRVNHTIERPHGTIDVHYVSLTQSVTRVAVTLRPGPQGPAAPGSPPPGAGAGSPPMMVPYAGPWGTGRPQVMLTDDRGTTTPTHLGGGGSPEEWRGHLRADQPLARDTAWIELDGERIDLIDEPALEEVSVQALPEQDPAWRHLWQRAASPDHRRRLSPESIEPAIEALVAAGALSATDPTLQDLRVAVADGGRRAIARGRQLPAAFARGERPLAVARGSVAAGEPPVTATSDRLPDAWRSLLRRKGFEGGPSGTIAIGAATPPLDGVSVAVISLESTQTVFTLEVEVSPDTGMRGPLAIIDERQIAWWARDEHGNHHLGQTGNWSGGGEYGQGQIHFWPALDPRATRLELMPTALTARAVIRVALSWADPPQRP